LQVIADGIGLRRLALSVEAYDDIIHQESPRHGEPGPASVL
jgi:hypothetical protein